jgi:hypothetical protein
MNVKLHQTVRVDISSLPAGMLVCRFSSGREEKMMKIAHLNCQ